VQADLRGRQVHADQRQQLVVGATGAQREAPDARPSLILGFSALATLSWAPSR
jgi:hypothetical protein